MQRDLKHKSLAACVLSNAENSTLLISKKYTDFKKVT